MLRITDKALCCGCGACANACPHHAITLRPDNEGFVYPAVDAENCTECGLCLRICPVVSGGFVRCNQTPEAYAAKNKNDAVRQSSSSGGIFTLLAERVLEKQGVVFGAALTADMEVSHRHTEDPDGLEQFRGSKYVQSAVEKSYPKVREFLEKGRTVLFSGTPCQIAGLKQYLGKAYLQLICVDIACHGVPSPLVWKAYLEEMEKQGGNQVCAAHFRDKTNGWNKFSMKLLFENGTHIISGKDQDPYLKAFLANYDLRPSCYNCAFKQHNSGADITLADFWGIEHILPEMDDDKGVSLILVNSEKGRVILEDIRDNLTVVAVDYQSAVRYNSAIIRSVYRPEERDRYICDVRKRNFFTLTNQYFSLKFHWRAFRKIRKKLRKYIK